MAKKDWKPSVNNYSHRITYQNQKTRDIIEIEKEDDKKLWSMQYGNLGIGIEDKDWGLKHFKSKSEALKFIIKFMMKN